MHRYSYVSDYYICTDKNRLVKIEIDKKQPNLKTIEY